MCGSGRGYTYPRDCEGIARYDCSCGGSHSKSGFCLRCGNKVNFVLSGDNEKRK